MSDYDSQLQFDALRSGRSSAFFIPQEALPASLWNKKVLRVRCALYFMEGIRVKKRIWKSFVVYILAMSMVFTWLAAPNTAMAGMKQQGSLDTVYLTSSATYPASGDGSTKEQPVKDIEKAFDLVADGGTIVIVDNYVHQVMLSTPVDKKITIKGEKNEDRIAFLTLRYGITLRNDLKFDNIRLETTSTETDGRCFYVNGYSLTMTDSVQCFTNQNVNQKSYIYAGSPDGSKISGRRAKIDVGGGDFAGIYGYGKGRAKVADGAEITLRSNVKTDQLDSASVLNLNSEQKLLGSIQNVDQLNITSPVNVYTLLNVKNLSLYSTLTLKTENDINLNGNLDLKGSAVLDITANLHAKGRISGYAAVAATFRKQITSDVPESSGTLVLDNSQIPWEIRIDYPGGKKRWYVGEKTSESVYYIDGENGDDNHTGASEDQAFASLSKALKAAASGRAKTVLKIVGDTQVNEPLDISLPGHSISICGNRSAPAKLVFNSPATIKETEEKIEFRDLRMDFNACRDQDGIIIKGADVIFNNNLTMEGAAPNIRYESGTEYQGQQQLDIYSGSYGNVIDENKQGILMLYNSNIQGKIRGWNSITAAPDSYDSQEVNVGGEIEDADFLILTGGCDSFRVYGNIQVSELETEGGEAKLKIASGHTIVTEGFTAAVAISILPENNTIKEGIYLKADTLVKGESASDISLTDTEGYVIMVEESAGQYIGTVKAAQQLEQPENVRWDQQNKGVIKWDKVENATSYTIEILEEGKNFITVKNVEAETYDCTDYIKLKGTYQVKIRAVDNMAKFAESKQTASELLYYLPKVIKVTFAGGDRQMTEGDTIQINSTVLPDDASDDLVWKSSNASVAQVDDKGYVTAVSRGTAQITATATDGSGVSAALKVTVSKKVQQVQRIRLDQTVKDLYPGDSFVLQAEVSPQDADDKSVAWSSSNTKAVSVSSSGRVTALAEGEAIITAAARDGSGIKAACTVKVKKRTYTIQYVMNGGRNHSGNPSGFTAAPVHLKAPERSGYLFAGWYTDSGFHNRIGTLTQKQNYQLYAKWQKISLKAPKVASLKKTVGTTLSVSYTKVQGAAGYEISISTSSAFRGSDTKKWNTSAVQKTAGGLKKNTQYYTRIRAYRLDSAGKRVYGPYSAKTKGYSIKYKLNKGKNSSSNLVSYYNVSVRLSNPVRKGYRFKGWYTSKKYKKRIKTISKGKRSNYTLYAKWKKK